MTKIINLYADGSRPTVEEAEDVEVTVFTGEANGLIEKVSAKLRQARGVVTVYIEEESK